MDRRVAAAVIMLALLAGCQQAIEQPVPIVCGDGTCSTGELCANDCDLWPNQTSSEDVINALRNLTRNRTIDDTTKGPELNDSRILVESIQAYQPIKGFRVASRHNLLAINENISSVMGRLTGLQMREVLRSGRLSSNTEAFGPRAAAFEQQLTLRGGKVRFGMDPETDLVSSYLEFEEGDIMLEYLLELHGGIFKFFEGEVIGFLGHDYLIGEVQNKTMQFTGLSTPDEILFRDASSISINSDTVSSEVVNVTYRIDYLRVQVKAPEDIRILPGSSLAQNLRDREILLTNRIDLAYEGLTDAPSNDIVFDKAGDRYRLQFKTGINLSYNVVLANTDPVRLGDEEYSFAFTESRSQTDYNVNRQDYFAIINNREIDGLSNILRLSDVDYEDRLITLEDPALEKFLIVYEGTPGVNATADLIVYDVIHRIRVGSNDSIAIDMNGDGSFNGAKIPIVTWGNGIIRLESNNSESINLTFTVPARMREDVKKDLVTRITITEGGVGIDERDLELHDDNDNLVGMSDFGTFFAIRGHTRGQSGDDLLIRHPLWQRFAEVVVKAYE